jgi:cephalosporin hydroxylase
MQPPPMQQYEQEFTEFLGIVSELGIRSYLEIGSKFGGSLYRVGMVMPAGSECVAVDMPNGTKAWPESERSLRAVADELTRQGRKCSLIWGDSADPKVVRQVVAARAAYDMVFIDANHTLPYVRKDWENYGKLAEKAVVFHDISWDRGPEWTRVRIEVPAFWRDIKQAHHYTELKYDPTRRDNGLGIIYVR